MGRRRAPAEASIGTESFLDIIANIVGILIILIVVAGVRVSQAPVLNVPAPQPIEQRATSFPVPEYAIGTTAASEWTIEELLPQEPEIPEPVVIDVTPTPDPQLVITHNQQTAEQARLQAELAALQQDLERAKQELATAESSFAEVNTRAEAQTAELLSAKNIYTQLQQELSDTQRQEEAARRNLAQLAGLLKATEQELDETQQEKPVQGVLLRHDMTPVSEIVRRKELHFMVQNGRVSEVPIEELLELIKDQIDQRKDWILRSNRHTGTVGPVRGFLMEYVVEKENLSTLDQLRIGSGVVRIILSKWILKPDPQTLVEETVAQAGGSTSRFLISVRSAPPDASCTFWVYPESFETYQELKKLVHESGLRVAGRPLPKGIPITGSPSGSRSASQ